MEKVVKAYKRKFDSALKHIKVILLLKKKTLPYEEWLLLVHQTKSAMINDPSEFWCGELPSSEITTEAIEKVFEGFSADLRSRNAQNRNVPWMI